MKDQIFYHSIHTQSQNREMYFWMRQRVDSVVLRAAEDGEVGGYRYRSFFLRQWNVLKWTLVKIPYVCEYPNIYSMAHFKLVNFKVCGLCLNKAAILKASSKTNVHCHCFYLALHWGTWQWWRFRRSVVSDFCDPMDHSPPRSSVLGILKARILEWVAISFFRGSSRPRDRTQISLTAGRFFPNWGIREAREPGVKIEMEGLPWWSSG